MLHTTLFRSSLRFLLLAVLTFTLACSRGSVVDDSLSDAAKTYRPPANPPGPVDNSVNSYNIQMLQGGATRVSDLVGKNKVVLVNFWATWCGPCKREIPELKALKQQFSGREVEIIGLTIEEPDKESFVRAFVQQFSINYTVGFAPVEAFMLFNNANGRDPRAPIPQTFIFGRDGKLIDSAKGFRANYRAWAEGAIGYALKNS